MKLIICVFQCYRKWFVHFYLQRKSNSFYHLHTRDVFVTRLGITIQGKSKSRSGFPKMMMMNKKFQIFSKIKTTNNNFNAFKQLIDIHSSNMLTTVIKHSGQHLPPLHALPSIRTRRYDRASSPREVNAKPFLKCCSLLLFLCTFNIVVHDDCECL